MSEQINATNFIKNKTEKVNSSTSNTFPHIISSQEGLKNDDKHNAKINYAEKQLEINNEVHPFEAQETMLVLARTISDFYVRIKNSERKEEFVPQLHICNGVYLGKAIVSNNNDKAYMKKVNTNTQPQRLTIPSVELLDFEEVSINKKTINRIVMHMCICTADPEFEYPKSRAYLQNC